ncbi:MAG TPA: HAMP domain-containing protein, partial [Methanoculleus sp.]|nr:HAMP domain-containing protein [Methanoculleus sp.]
MIAVAAGIMIAFAPGETVPGEKVSPLDAMSALATEVAGQIDGDAMAAFKPGDENTPAFAA